MEDAILPIITFGVGILTTLIVLGANTLIDSFKKSSNTYDDALIPVLEKVAEALAKK